jgi:hypothetical protein
MQATGKQQGLSKLRITYLVVIITAVVGIGSFGYYIYRNYRDARLNLPQAQVERLIKDLRLYQSQTRQFPATFTEVNERIWHTKPVPDYGSDDRRARTKNYYYRYTKVNDETCAFWALPVGPQRHYAASFFVVLSPAWLRAWKGKALGDEEIAKLAEIPSPDALAEIGMQEMPAHVLTTHK